MEIQFSSVRGTHSRYTAKRAAFLAIVLGALAFASVGTLAAMRFNAKDSNIAFRGVAPQNLRVNLIQLGSADVQLNSATNDPQFAEEYVVVKKAEIDALKSIILDNNKTSKNYESMNPFQRLDLYKPVARRYYNSYPGYFTFFNESKFGIKKSDDYCNIVDTYNLAHPENIFEQMNFVTDYADNFDNPEQESLPRMLVMREIGNDVNPGINRYNRSNDTSAPVVPYIELNHTATTFFTKNVDFHMYNEISKNFLCVTQMYNHIPGHGVLKRKDLVVNSFRNYQKRYKHQPECFSEFFFPKTLRLYKKRECKEFFKELASEEYQERKEREPIQYLVKVGYGAHRAKGVFILSDKNEETLLKGFDHGAMCGVQNQSLIAQQYISNPLLLDRNNKFDFRIYMLVASTNPLIVYYHDGFLRVSLLGYDKFGQDRNVHLTNTHLSKPIFEKAAQEGQWQGMNEDDLRNYQMWTLERLADYLLSAGKIKDPNWLENFLRPAFKKAFIHLVRMSEHSYIKHSGVFEMFGLDFMLDDEMNLWFIECNSSPQLIGTNQMKTDILTKMLKDVFEIQYGLLRSRMQRIHLFMAEFHAEAARGDLDIRRLRNAFKVINRNKFEPKYLPSPDNSWEKIIDFTLTGKDKYMGLLKEKCIDDEF